MEFIQNELKEIKELLKKQTIQQKEYLTLVEAAIYLGQSKSSLYKLTCKKLIPHYKPSGKLIYFKRKELHDWLTRNRESSVHEMEMEVDLYLGKND